jgi:hypothetical protein
MSNEINIKAKELVEKYYDFGGPWHHAKQCALIAVERTIDTLVIVLNKSDNTESNNLINDEIDQQMLLKQAIEQL